MGQTYLCGPERIGMKLVLNGTTSIAFLKMVKITLSFLEIWEWNTLLLRTFMWEANHENAAILVSVLNSDQVPFLETTVLMLALVLCQW